MPRNPAPKKASRPAELVDAIEAADEVAEPANTQAAVAVVERPAPPNPAPAPPAEPCLVAVESLNRRAEELAAAEGILTKQVDGATLTPAEEEFLGYLYPGEFDLANELRRVKKRWRLQRDAGTKADREAASLAAEETAARLASESPAIESQIAELRLQLTVLEKSASDAKAEHESRAEALNALADGNLLREPSRSQYQSGRSRWEKLYGAPARTARGEAEGCLLRSAWHPERNVDEIGTYCQGTKGCGHIVSTHITTHKPSPFRGDRTDGEIRDSRKFKVNVAAWRDHAAELRERAEALMAEAEKIERDGEPLRAELSAMMNSLIPD